MDECGAAPPTHAVEAATSPALADPDAGRSGDAWDERPVLDAVVHAAGVPLMAIGSSSSLGSAVARSATLSGGVGAGRRRGRPRKSSTGTTGILNPEAGAVVDLLMVAQWRWNLLPALKVTILPLTNWSAVPSG